MSNLPPPPPPGPDPPPGYQLQQQGYGYSYGPGPPAQLAGFWRRFGGWLIDVIIVGIFGVPARIVLETGETEIDTCPGDPTALCEVPTDETAGLALLLGLAAFVAGLLYYALLEGRRGQTVGKMAAGVAVVDMTTGQPIGVGRGIGRYFARILSGLPLLLGYFWMLWDPKKQTWHDKLTRAVVVRRPT
jgi:uncharacterized RDD family membrane protein YckC